MPGCGPHCLRIKVSRRSRGGVRLEEALVAAWAEFEAAAGDLDREYRLRLGERERFRL